MAVFAFISLYDQSAYGIKILSSCLKQAGHKRHIIFLKAYATGKPTERVRVYEGETPWQGVGPHGTPFVYAVSNDITDTEKKILTETLRTLKPDMIGLTVNSPLKQRAIAVTEHIKAELPGVPVIWGGFEPTLHPEDSLGYCDIACRGEAERTVVELADAIDAGRDYRSIGNLCFKNGGSYIKNDLYPPADVLDALPFQDFDHSGNFLIEGDKVVESPTILSHIEGFYNTISGRGCVYQCSYCCERYLKEIYSPHPFLRRRSPEDVIRELTEVKEKNDLKYIIFQDEVFSHQMEWLEKFVPLYKEKIGLPFTCYVVPSTDFDYKIRLLKDAGLSSTCLAIQSGSKRINRLYKRSFNEGLTLKAAASITSLGLSFYTDVITYNPAEDVDDLEDTLSTLLKLPQPYDICVNKLYLMPGTELSEKIKRIQLDKAKTRLFDYYSSLFWIASYFRCSRKIVAGMKSIPLLRKRPALLKPALHVLSVVSCMSKVTKKVHRLKETGRLNFTFINAYVRAKLKV